MQFVRHHPLVPSPGANMRPYAIQRLNNYTFSPRLHVLTTQQPTKRFTITSLSKNNIGDDFGADMFVKSVDQSLAAEGELAAESGRGEMYIEFAVADM